MGDAPVGLDSGSPAPSTAPVAGSNTFGTLKGLFKEIQAKKCKHCGASFIPKAPGATGIKI